MADIEKDAAHLNENRGEALNKTSTAGGFSLSPELFEKIYLSPKNAVKGDLRSILANPTPLGLSGLLLGLTPLAASLMGWRGAGGGGAAIVGDIYFSGGLVLIIASVLEFILGNTFPFVVFGTYGGFFLSLAATLTPSFNASNAYEPSNPLNPGFHASFAFYFLSLGIISFFFLLASIRTNIFFLTIFLTLTFASELLAAAYWQLANGNVALAGHLQIAAGAFIFVTALSGWYLILVQILASVDFPLSLPVGDLSGYIRGASERAKPAE